jgi:hypothetical protein
MTDTKAMRYEADRLHISCADHPHEDAIALLRQAADELDDLHKIVENQRPEEFWVVLGDKTIARERHIMRRRCAVGDELVIACKAYIVVADTLTEWVRVECVQSSAEAAKERTDAQH